MSPCIALLVSLGAACGAGGGRARAEPAAAEGAHSAPAVAPSAPPAPHARPPLDPHGPRADTDPARPPLAPHSPDAAILLPASPGPHTNASPPLVPQDPGAEMHIPAAPSPGPGAPLGASPEAQAPAASDPSPGAPLSATVEAQSPTLAQPWALASPVPGCLLDVRALPGGALLVPRATVEDAIARPSLAGVSASLATGGLRLDSVSAGGLASCLGLQAGDLLTAVAGVPLLDPVSALPLLSARGARPGRVPVWFRRGLVSHRVVVVILAEDAAP